MIQRNLSENRLIQSKNEVHLYEVTLNQSLNKYMLFFLRKQTFIYEIWIIGRNGTICSVPCITKKGSM